MTAADAQRRPPATPGQPYSPFKLFSFAPLPLAIAAHPALSSLSKLLFGVLAYHAGKDAHTFVSVRELARELRSSIDSITRGLGELIAAGLIQRKRGGDGRPATCTFIWCNCLETSLRKPVSDSAEMHDLKAPSDSAKVRNLNGRTDSAEMHDLRVSDSADLRKQTPQFCGSDSAKVRSHYKEEEVQEEVHLRESSSSSARGDALDIEEEENSLRFGRFMYENLRGEDVWGPGPDIPKPPNTLVREILALAPGWTVGQIEAGVLMQATVHGTRTVHSYNWFKIAVRDAVKACGGTPPEPIEPVQEHVDGDNGLGPKRTSHSEREYSSAPAYSPLTPEEQVEETHRQRQNDRWAEIYDKQRSPIKHLMDKLSGQFYAMDSEGRDGILGQLADGSHPIFSRTQEGIKRCSL
jgi:hypothetical protein